MVGLYLLLNAGIKLLSALDCILSKELVIGLLVLLSGNEGFDIDDSESKLRIKGSEFVFSDFQHGGPVGLIGESLIDIHCNLVISLEADKLRADILGNILD